MLSLVAFGAAGLLDAAGSMALVASFRHALRHDELADHHERRASLIIGAGMIVLGVLTVIESVRRLASGHGGDHASLGVAIAAASVVVLSGLSVAKRRVARDIGSDALLADAHLSAAGAALAVVAIVGATLGTRDGTWWVDAAAAVVIALVTVRIGAQVASGPRTGQSPPE